MDFLQIYIFKIQQSSNNVYVRKYIVERLLQSEVVYLNNIIYLFKYKLLELLIS